MNTLVEPQISFKEILVASDLSDASVNATNYAKAVAKRFGSHILLVHVGQPVNPVAIPKGESFWDEAIVEEQEVAAAGMALWEEGFSAEAVNVPGSTREEIQALAKVHKSDLIVLGTHGRSGLNRLVGGSQAEILFRHSDRPVLIVGPCAAPAPQEWRPKSALCATTLDFREIEVVAHGYHLAQSLGAEFSLVLVSVDAAQEPSESEDAWCDFKRALAKALHQSEIRPGQLRPVLAHNGATASVLYSAQSLRADLIIMGARNEDLTESDLSVGVLSQVVAKAPCPVLATRVE